MKTLYIVRHAKSSWEFPELSDEERPLLEKGKKRTKKIVDYLLDSRVTLDHIISSPATRAIETARIIARALGYPVMDIRQDSQIYHANSDRLLDQFFDLPNRFKSVMIVGHNPAFTNFANQFISPPIDWLPTSGVVSVSFDTDRWEEIPLAKRHTNFVIAPRDLRANY